MSEISDKIHEKCLAFSDRIIKLNDYLLEQAANKKAEVTSRAEVRGKRADGQTSNFKRQTSSRVPVFLQSVATICNQLLRAGTSIGANNSEATSAISKADYKAKSYIALKEARESLYWINLLHRNGYLEEKQYESIFADAEELVKILVARCQKLDSEGGKEG
jgi:four helix bundle protein